MTTPLTDEQIDAEFFRQYQGGASKGDKHIFRAGARFARALLAQPSVAPPAPGGDVLAALPPLTCPNYLRSNCALYDPQAARERVSKKIAADPDWLAAEDAAGGVLAAGALVALQSTQAPTAATQGQDAAPAEQPQDGELLADTPTPKPQAGLWTLTAPDGRMYQADSPLRCCGLEQRERIPADVAMARIIRASSEPDDSELLDWLDATNKRFKMGWKVSVAPAGNCSVQSVICLGNSEPVTIRAAIRAARAKE